MNIHLIEKLKAEDSLLCTLLENGTITPEAVEQNYYMTKFTELDKVHSNRIFQVEVPRTGKTQWRTYVGIGKNRKLISDGSKTNLKIKLLSYYGLTEETKVILYDCWLRYNTIHPSMVNSTNSTLRMQQIYNQYLSETEIMKRPVSTLRKADLEIFCNELIKTRNLTKESWGNVKAILNGIFEAAIDMDEISINPLQHVNIKVKFAQSNKRPKENLYFNSDELARLRRWLLQEYQETGNITCIAILIQAVTGMRVGELGALTWSDILKDSIHIHRELVLDQSTNVYSIVEHTKGYTNRFIPLHPKMKTYLQMLEERGPGYQDLLLSFEDDFLTTMDVNNLLTKYARRHGLVVKRSHCIRRTYATLLYLAGEDKENIREYLGHADISTTERYICAKREVGKSQDILSRAL